MGLEHELVKFLDGMIEACEGFRKNFTDAGVTSSPTSQPTPPAMRAQAPPVQKAPEPIMQSGGPATFQEMKEALNNEKWPEAVNRNLICDPNSEKDKNERGRGILELMIEEELKGLKFLDYGCGEGHCAYLAADYDTVVAVGYDIVEHPQWRKFEPKDKSILTTDMGLVEKNAPYDIIILFDVIDHLKGDAPTQTLSRLKNLLSPEGKIYMRCHPFTSRHATHLYHDINKAYVHLVFSEDELKQLVPESKFYEQNIGVTFPLMTYAQYIEEAGLQVVNRRDIKENPEEFFKIPKIAERIQAITKHKEFPEFQMSLQFVDYVLRK